MKRIVALALFVSIIMSQVSFSVSAAETESCFVSSDRFYDATPSQYASLSPEEEEALLGTVTAKYESNGNPGAISSGNGDAGGVSFGAYQFASRAGTPLTFVNWCINTERAPQIGTRLLSAYTSDGNTYGDAFKAEWKALATEDPDGFLAVQHAFVKATYYDAIVSRVEKNISGFDIDTYGIALKNVFWSRSVQHGVGGAYNVISRAFTALGGFDGQSEELLIRAIYAESGALSETGTNQISGTKAEELGIDGLYMKYYSANSSSVQTSVYRRLHINELTDILNMLRSYGGYVSESSPSFEAADARIHRSDESSAQICGFIYNYDGKQISEYGILVGRNKQSLEHIPLGADTDQTVLPVVATADGLTENRAYLGGVYAISDGEYSQSELVSFATGEVVYHTVTFLGYDGKVLATVDVQNGDPAVYTGPTPTKPPDTYLVYSFTNWSADLSSVTEDMTVFPLFSTSQRLYTVTFLDYDGTVLDTVGVPYGDAAEYGGAVTPSRPGNALYRKVFSGWDKDLKTIVADTVCKPVFDNVSYLWDGSSADKFAAGNGTESSPYLIYTAQELALFSALVNNGNTDICGRLEENIVLNHPSSFKDEESVTSAITFTPIGSRENPFSGKLDGQGFRIVGLAVSADDSGLFGVIDGGEVRDLILDQVNSKGTENAGGLAGQIKGAAVISGIAVYGNIASDDLGGGLCGLASGGATIENIYCSGSVTAAVAGGIGGSFAQVRLNRVFSQCDLWANTVGGVGGRWQSLLSFSLCFYEERSDTGDMIAVPVSPDALSVGASYHGLADLVEWTLTDNGARLFIDCSNTFNYDVKGDFNLDGRINAIDAVLYAQYLAGWNIENVDHNDKFDLNGDVISNVTDSVILAQIIAGWNIS